MSLEEGARKSESAFEAWYINQEEVPMPSDCWNACKAFLLEELRAHRRELDSLGRFVYWSDVAEILE